MFERIYLDMDGVIADFDSSARRIIGMSPSDYESIYGKEGFWEEIYCTPNFFEKLDIFNYTNELVESLSKISKKKLVILSSPSSYNKTICITQKRKWIDRHLGGNFPAIFEKNKYKFAGKNRLLVDDTLKKIEGWEKHGGKGYLFTSYELFKQHYKIKELQNREI